MQSRNGLTAIGDAILEHDIAAANAQQHTEGEPMKDIRTLGPESARLALECTYELESVADLMMVACPDDAPEFRGLALRVRALAGVIMAIVDDNGIKHDKLQAVVYGKFPPDEC